MERALTPEEKKLLKYPPTETTWICVHTEHYVAADGEKRPVLREYANAGSRTTCGFCAEPRPRNAQLVWPRYQEALAKKERAESGR